MRSSSSSLRRARPILGTVVEIRVRGNSKIGAEAMERAFGAIERVHRLMSAHDPRSDVSRINRSGRGAVISVDSWTFEVLQRAKEIHRQTEGLFDCAVAPLLAESGHLPAANCSERESGTLGDLELFSGSRVRLRKRLGVTLDGIAKGYAVDRAVEELVGSGIAQGVVNAGGDLRVFGDDFETIHVRHPESPQKLLPLVKVRNAAVASSAAYHSRAEIQGRTVSHIADPVAGTLCDPAHGATVLAEDCTTADALTKPVLLDPERGRAVATKLGAKAFVIDANGAIQ